MRGGGCVFVFVLFVRFVFFCCCCCFFWGFTYLFSFNWRSRWIRVSRFPRNSYSHNRGIPNPLWGNALRRSGNLHLLALASATASQGQPPALGRYRRGCGRYRGGPTGRNRLVDCGTSGLCRLLSAAAEAEAEVPLRLGISAYSRATLAMVHTPLSAPIETNPKSTNPMSRNPRWIPLSDLEASPL